MIQRLVGLCDLGKTFSFFQSRLDEMVKEGSINDRELFEALRQAAEERNQNAENPLQWHVTAQQMAVALEFLDSFVRFRLTFSDMVRKNQTFEVAIDYFGCTCYVREPTVPATYAHHPSHVIRMVGRLLDIAKEACVTLPAALAILVAYQEGRAGKAEAAAWSDKAKAQTGVTPEQVRQVMLYSS